MPTPKSVSDIKANLLRPALTSHYEVEIGEPRGNWTAFRGANLPFSNSEKGQLTLSCCDTVLPGSTLSTHDINNDFTGVTERHAYRRLYDDRIDLTFYVDAEKYLAIKFFETWIKYIANEQVAASGDAPGVNREDYSYAFRYPDDYVGSLKIIKFEKTGKDNAYSGPQLSYHFVNAFPIAINSMGVSYESSQLLKCTVSFTYIRYYIESIKGGVDPAPAGQVPASNQAFTPAQQAGLNKVAFNPAAFSTNQIIPTTTTGGVNFNSSAASGNSISVKDAYGGNFTLN
jgi:hypothetical protein